MCNGTDKRYTGPFDGWVRWDLAGSGPAFQAFDKDTTIAKCTAIHSNVGFWFPDTQKDLCGPANLNGVGLLLFKIKISSPVPNIVPRSSTGSAEFEAFYHLWLSADSRCLDVFETGGLCPTASSSSAADNGSYPATASTTGRDRGSSSSSSWDSGSSAPTSSKKIASASILKPQTSSCISCI